MKLFCQTFTFLYLIILGSHVASAQDIIVKTDQTELKTKVFEIEETKIKYKQFDHQDGPIYSINKSEVFMIIYQNGKRETFSQAQTTDTQAAAHTTTAAVKPEPETPASRERNTLPNKQSQDTDKKNPLHYLAGITISNYDFRIDGKKTEHKYSPGIGVTLGVGQIRPLTEDLLLDADIRASLYRSKVEASSEHKYSTLWIELSPSVAYRLDNGLQFKAGPYIGVGVLGEQKSGSTTHELFKEGGLKRLNAGIGIGAKYSDFFIEYRRGLTNVEDNDSAVGQKSILHTFNIGFVTSF